VLPVNEDKSARYHRLKRRVAVLELLCSAGLLALLLASGSSASMRDLAIRLTGGSASSAWTVAAYVLFWIAIQEVVTFPLAWQGSYVLEKRYGLLTSTPRAWLRDHLKALALSVVAAIGVAEAIYTTIRVFPQWWWLAATGVLGVLLLSIAVIFPILLLPLFYSLTPLDKPALRERLLELSKRAGVRVLGVYQWGLGDKTRRANAALVGLGATRRILVSDTMLAEYSDDEIEVVLAHEISHHVHRDVARSIAIEIGLFAVAFLGGAVALRLLGPALGLTGEDDVAGLPLLALVGGGVMLLATPLVNALSRVNERRADRYALSMTRQPAAFMSAMRRLGAQNLAEEYPSRLVLWLFHSHPPIPERIEAARAFAAAE
jgi:STE24 endopeptidase